MHTLEAIADPTRRRIVEMLARRDHSVGEIVEEFSMSAPAISQHLKVLREAGLVNSRVDGQTRIQTLNPMGLQQIHSWLITTMNFWNQRLDALEAMLLAEDEAEAAKKKAVAKSEVESKARAKSKGRPKSKRSSKRKET